jgi:hypothetical protein
VREDRIMSNALVETLDQLIKERLAAHPLVQRAHPDDGRRCETPIRTIARSRQSRVRQRLHVSLAREVANYESYVVLDQVDEVEQGGRTLRVESRRTVLYGMAVVAARFKPWLVEQGLIWRAACRHPRRFGLPSRGGPFGVRLQVGSR